MSAPNRYVCIHGHFYQPPRENPWLDVIEQQDSAYPYHDWNQRISAECYAPNAAARILDDRGRIVRLVNNFSRMSFDVGPTLLAWLEIHQADTYAAILEADHISRGRFEGHGSAIAQAYNHTILPLANHRDRVTQVVWGIRDFEKRFGRSPEGMWLPETAVNTETLEVLAGHGIRFTILAPHQAARCRPPGHDAWIDVDGDKIDPTRPYRAGLPSGATIDLLFYDGPLSRAVAFEHLLDDGEGFTRRLLAAFSDDDDRPRLVHIATDGETFGHHHRFGEMALAYALDSIENGGIANPINYAAYLARHPPDHEVEIRERTSWSCSHGVSRWSDDCGCSVGRVRGRRRNWRRPLRETLDWLRDALTGRYESAAAELLHDPWAARDDYVRVVLDRSAESVDRFIDRHARGPLEPEGRLAALELLEMQRHLQLMFTSCGWFFDDVSGIETIQILQYAGRAVQLAGRRFGVDLEQDLLNRLEAAPSDDPAWQNGRRVYERAVRPARVGLREVAAHYTVSSLFEPYADRSRLYAYEVVREGFFSMQDGRARVLGGAVRVTATVTGETSRLSVGALHFGDHNVVAGVRDWPGRDTHDALLANLREAFGRADLPAAVRALDRGFPEGTYSLHSLFRDPRRRLTRQIMKATLGDAEELLERVYRQHGPTLRVLDDLDVPLPEVLQAAAEFVLSAGLKRAFGTARPDIGRIRALLESAETHRVRLTDPGLRIEIESCLDRLTREVVAEPREVVRWSLLNETLETVTPLGFDLDLTSARRRIHRLPWPPSVPQVRAVRERVEATLGFRSRV